MGRWSLVVFASNWLVELHPSLKECSEFQHGVICRITLRSQRELCEVLNRNDLVIRFDEFNEVLMLEEEV